MQTYGTAEITSQELMDALHISLRTANKFLSNLEKNGYAQVAGLKRSGNKGRPVNVYRILMNYEN
ncbi:MAG: winged helix-turn-helix transcriptional regulator [Blautia hansenii]